MFPAIFVSRLQPDRPRFLAAMPWAGTVLAPALFSVSFAACESLNCIDIDCGPPSVEIKFKPAITSAGHYRLDLDVDGVRSTCELEFRPAEGHSGASACGSLLLRGGVSRDLATDIVGYALPQAANVSLTLTRDGQLWAEHSFEPRYRGVELRGEGCGECIVATEEVELPSPSPG